MQTNADTAAAVAMIVVGLVALAGGAEGVVRGALAIARRLRISPLLVGLTVVGFGTSTPELTASVGAALKDAPGIAVGNVVGSNIANILLILGVSALIAPIATTRKAFLRDGSALLAASLILAGVCVLGNLGRGIGLALLLLLVAYVWLSFRLDRQGTAAAADLHREQAEAVALQPSRLWAAVAWSLAGLAALVGGAALLVEGALVIARSSGISETVIGLTVVAVGTSLPELATSVVAALRRQSDVAFGNIVGSNIFNILGILGVTALVSPMAIPDRIAAFDVWLMLGVTMATVAFAVSGWRICRWEGAVLLAAYLAYTGALFWPGASTVLGLP